MRDKIKTFGLHPKGMLVVFFLLFLVALSQQLYQFYFIFRQERFVDFYVYWEAARFALEGGDFYQKLFFDGTPFNYPPTALLFFSFLSWLPKSIGSLILLTVSLCSLFTTIFVLTRLQLRKSERLIFFLLSSIFFIQYFPTKFTLTLGQINLVILLLMTASFYTFKKKQDILAGIYLGLAFLIKILPVFLLIFYLKEKRKKAIFAFLITSILGILLASLLFNSVSIANYFGYIGKDIFLKAGGVSYFDQSLNSFLMRLQLVANLRLWLRFFLSLFLLLVFLKTKNKALSYFGLGVVTTVFLPSFAWLHHYVILIPLMILLFSKIDKNSPLFVKIALVLSYLACSLHFRRPESFALKNIVLASHPFIGAAVLLFSAQCYSQKETS